MVEAGGHSSLRGESSRHPARLAPSSLPAERVRGVEQWLGQSSCSSTGLRHGAQWVCIDRVTPAWLIVLTHSCASLFPERVAYQAKGGVLPLHFRLSFYFRIEESKKDKAGNPCSFPLSN